MTLLVFQCVRAALLAEMSEVASAAAGTVATDSGLRVQVTAVGEDTALAGIGRLVADAQNSTSRAQRIADTAAGWLFWFALGAAIISRICATSAGDS